MSIENLKPFTATSGNVCKFQVEENAKRIGVIARWLRKPTENDAAEVHQYIMSQTETPKYSFSLQGSMADGGAFRSAMAVKNFLEKGDPGVPFQSVNITKRTL